MDGVPALGRKYYGLAFVEPWPYLRGPMHLARCETHGLGSIAISYLSPRAGQLLPHYVP